MDHGIEKQGRLGKPQDFLKKNQMAGTAYGQKFGNTLDQAQENGLKNTHDDTIITLSGQFKALGIFTGLLLFLNKDAMLIYKIVASESSLNWYRGREPGKPVSAAAGFFSLKRQNSAFPDGISIPAWVEEVYPHEKNTANIA
jgi:hypothetical protein